MSHINEGVFNLYDTLFTHNYRNKWYQMIANKVIKASNNIF